jgi:hypothetical protein
VLSSSRSPETGEPTRWTVVAYVYALVAAAGFGYFLFAVPVQLTDSFGNLVQVRAGTLGSQIYAQLYQASYLRPLLWGHLRVIADLSGGHYYEWFRWWHVGQVTVLMLLFVRLLHVRTPADFAAVPLGLAALVGIHTFAGTVREAFPINTFMTILLCCLAAADLALSPPRWWRSVTACVVMAFAALTVESGLLVAVVVVAAWMAGARGVSGRGVLAVVLMVAGYLWLRFVFLEVGSPGLMERTSAYGFGKLEPRDLMERFGSNPLPFYVYNVVSSIASVLFAEPRAGEYAMTRDLLANELKTWQYVALTASTLGTLVIVTFAWIRRGEWWRLRFDRDDQLVLVFAAMVGFNAFISYAYTKDVIMSPAGAFFALALAAATRRVALGGMPGGPERGWSSWRAVALTVLLCVMSAAWAVRAIGIHVGLRHSALVMRNEWAYADLWFADEGQTPTGDAARLKDQLQLDAVSRHPAPAFFVGDWLEWFEE